MSHCHRTFLFTLGLVAASILPGCNQRLIQERDALFSENQELNELLASARAELQSSQGRSASLQSELDGMRLGAESAMPTETGFSEIDGIDVFQGVGTVTVRVPGDVLFSSGKVDLKQTAKRTLGQIGGVLQSEYTHNTVRIEGHTDTDPIKKSGWKDNLELSLQRAAAVQRYLESQGLNGDRIYAAGFGATKPRESKSKSRRVEIVVVQE